MLKSWFPAVLYLALCNTPKVKEMVKQVGNVGNSILLLKLLEMCNLYLYL